MEKGLIKLTEEFFKKRFPNKDTNIGYFAEKVCQYGVEQKIKGWEYDNAIEEIEEEIFKDFNISKEEFEKFDNYSYISLSDIENKKEKVMYFIKERFCFDNQGEMLEALAEFDNEFDTSYQDEGWRYGEDYTTHFKFVFDILKSVADPILNTIYPDLKEEKE
jgi:hypothetical protein